MLAFSINRAKLTGSTPGVSQEHSKAAVGPLRLFIVLATVIVCLCSQTQAQSNGLVSSGYTIPTANGSPSGIVSGADGAVWFGETNANKIGRITTAGVVTEFTLLPYLSACSSFPSNCGPYNLAFGSDGALWFTASHEIGRLPATGPSALYAVSGNPLGITAGSDGAVWFTEIVSSQVAYIGRITTSGVLTETQVPNLPGSIAAGSDGALWFMDTANGAIGRITTGGVVTQYSAPSIAGVTDSGQLMSVGFDGALWFGGLYSVGRIGLNGAMSIYNLPTTINAVAITKGPDGAMWFTTTLSGQIGRITTSGTVTLFDLSKSLHAGSGIALGSDSALWISGPSSASSSIFRVQVPVRTGVFSHIAAGGGWTTVVTVVNTSSAAVPVTVAFHNEDGTAMSLPFTTTSQGISQTSTSSVTATINPNATMLITTGSLPSTAVGWADVTSTGSVGGFAIFRQTQQNGSASEGTVPLQTTYPSLLTLPFDNTGGFLMGVALVNLSTTSANITATIWDDTGSQLGTQNLILVGNGHTSFVLPTLIPLTAGKRGVVQFQSAALGGLAGLGLRFSPFGTFTSVPAM
jgi:virginiamycin B lyase